MTRSPAGKAGYVLLELVAAFAVVALLTGILPPILEGALVHGDLNQVGVRLVTFLRNARTRSLEGGGAQLIVYDGARNVIASGRKAVTLGDDFHFSYNSAASCEGAVAVFLPNGAACGSEMHLAKGSRSLRIEVNAADGAIEATYE